MPKMYKFHLKSVDALLNVFETDGCETHEHMTLDSIESILKAGLDLDELNRSLSKLAYFVEVTDHSTIYNFREECGRALSVVIPVNIF